MKRRAAWFTLVLGLAVALCRGLEELVEIMGG